MKLQEHLLLRLHDDEIDKHSVHPKRTYLFWSKRWKVVYSAKYVGIPEYKKVPRLLFSGSVQHLADRQVIEKELEMRGEPVSIGILPTSTMHWHSVGECECLT